MAESESFLSKLGRFKDEAVEEMAHELLTNPRFAQSLGRAVDRVVKAKKRANRNVELVLKLSGVPAKSDYDRLAERALSLGKSIARMEERLDLLTLRLENGRNQSRER